MEVTPYLQYHGGQPIVRVESRLMLSPRTGTYSYTTALCLPRVVDYVSLALDVELHLLFPLPRLFSIDPLWVERFGATNHHM
jgi:hypothetical protein